MARDSFFYFFIPIYYLKHFIFSCTLEGSQIRGQTIVATITTTSESGAYI